MNMLYLLGEPGIGKTTLSRALFHGLNRVEKTLPYICWTEYHPKLCEIGRDRDTFGGTDALGMASQKKVIDWLESEPYPYVYAEGDRLANGKFFTWAQEFGVDLQIIHLTGERVAAKRRKKRNEQIGKEQNESWIASRRTKIQNVVKDFEPVVLELDASVGLKDMVKFVYSRTTVGRAIYKVRSSKS